MADVWRTRSGIEIAEHNIRRLVNADNDIFRELLLRFSRLTSGSGIKFNCLEMAWLFISPTDNNKRKLVSDFYSTSLETAEISEE